MHNEKTPNEIRDHLMALGIETPILFNAQKIRTDEDRIAKLESLVAQIMEELELDLTDDSLAETPHRVAKMWVTETYEGLNWDNFPKITTIQNKFAVKGVKHDPITVSDIEVLSQCEHHLVQIDGKAKISYVPKDRVIGLSKLNRIVQFFSRRPQVQERLNAQIHATLCFILGTDDVAVEIDAVHYCVKARGIRDSQSHTSTGCRSGIFAE